MIESELDKSSSFINQKDTLVLKKELKKSTCDKVLIYILFLIYNNYNFCTTLSRKLYKIEFTKKGTFLAIYFNIKRN